MQDPVYIEQVCTFHGAVIHYCDIWPCISLILASLTNLTKKETYFWILDHQ